MSSNKSTIVSVCMITYNHENYIREAIEGVLMQQCNFQIELIIGEDFSTDKTRQICQEYASTYPFINLLPSESNFGMISNFIRTLQACNGRYIALCEGDDYWTDPLKVQKQVDFLEANKDFSICFHNLEVIYDDGRATHLSNSQDQTEISTIEDLAQGNYIYTASCVFRNGLIRELPIWFNYAPVGDYGLHMLNAQHGKINYFNDVMGVYRVHKGGIWESRSYISRVESWVKLLELMKDQFTPEVNKIIEEVKRNYYSELIAYYDNDYEKSKYYSKLLLESNPFLINEYKRQIEELRSKNEAIINSNTYKTGKFLLKPYTVLKNLFNA